MTTDWTIQSRSHQCSATGQPFQEGEHFYTLLYTEGGGYRREDICEEAFKSREEQKVQPLSFWRSKYENPPTGEEPVVSKQSAEDLLRSYMEQDDPGHNNARYILALMLERKRVLKEREVKTNDDGTMVRIYEHGKSGEVFVIPDPQLRLDQVAEIQMQVADLLK